MAAGLPGGSWYDTDGLQIAVSKCDIGGLQMAVFKCDIGGLQIAVFKCDIGELLIAVSKCDIGGLQTAVSKCDIGGLLIAVSKCDIGGLQIAVFKCDIAGTWTESCEVVAYSEGILEATCGAPNKAASNLNYTLCPATSLVTNDYATLALMETGLPRTLCRLVVVSTTPADQKLQALAMLRVFVADPSSHTLLVEAKVIHTIVGQVGAVAVVKGKVLNKATSSPTKALSPDGKPVEAVWNAEQHMVELSVLMLADLGRVFKRMEDSQSHERVRVAAAGALAYLMEDGAIALEVAKANGLVGLVDMMRSPSLAMSESARNAVKVMLTPSPPTSAPSNATPAAADAAPSKSDVDQMVDLMIEMGKGFSPAAVNCLMDVIASGDKELRPLAMALLPLTATDPLCRRTIMSHAMGGPELFRAAGQGDMSAVDTLRRVAGDSTLRQAVAAELAKAVASELAARLAELVTRLAKLAAELAARLQELPGCRVC
eukprot:gene28606-31775_t